MGGIQSEDGMGSVEGPVQTGIGPEVLKTGACDGDCVSGMGGPWFWESGPNGAETRHVVVEGMVSGTEKDQCAKVLG